MPVTRVSISSALKSLRRFLVTPLQLADDHNMHSSFIVLIALVVAALAATSPAYPDVYTGVPTLGPVTGNFSLLVTIRDFRGCERDINTSYVPPDVRSWPPPRCAHGGDTAPGPANCLLNTGGVPELNSDFEGWPSNCGIPKYQFGMTEDYLDPVLGIPVWNHSMRNYSVCMFSTSSNFDMWYRDVPGYNTLLYANAEFGLYPKDPTPTTVGPVVDWGSVYVWDQWTAPYFPIDYRGFGNYCWRDSQTVTNDTTRNECLWQIDAEQRLFDPTTGACTGTVYQHNFHFTDFFHMDFIMEAANPPKFRITGDDDMWVYINGKRIMDLGGINWVDAQTVVVDSGTWAQLGLTDGKVARLSWFHAQRKVECSHHLMVTNLKPICPLERQGQICGGTTPDGCSTYKCVNNTCQPVTTNTQCGAQALPPCHKPLCLANGQCGSMPDPTQVNNTCIPGAGQTALPCNHYFCDSNGECVGRPNDTMVGQSCVPPPDIAMQFSEQCGDFVCAGNGTCVMQPNPQWVNNTCTHSNASQVPSDTVCRQYKCGSLGQCVLDAGSVGLGQVCVPPSGATEVCHVYTCQDNFLGGTVCQASVNTSQVGSTCVPATPLNECSKAVCAATGECVAQPDPTRVDTHCTPAPGSGLSQHSCSYFICSSLGVCDKPVLNSSMVGMPCIPDGITNSTLLNCSIFICAGNGSCISTGWKNTTGCPGAIRKGGGKAMIIGIAAGAGVLALAIAGVVIFLALGGGPLVGLGSAGGLPAAAAVLDNNPLFVDKVASSPAYTAS